MTLRRPAAIPSPPSWNPPSLSSSLLTVQVAINSDVVFISVKPHRVVAVLREIRSSLTENHTVVSVAAGVTLAT